MIQRRLSSRIRGFTVVEVMVIIVVIVILAGMTIAAYSLWRERTATTEVKSDLTSVAAAMEDARNFSDSGYPIAPTFSTTNDIFTASQRVELNYAVGGSSAYCINGSSIAEPGIEFYIASNLSEPQEGTCADWTPSPGAGGGGSVGGSGTGM